jgi:hypothetical protein
LSVTDLVYQYGVSANNFKLVLPHKYSLFQDAFQRQACLVAQYRTLIRTLFSKGETKEKVMGKELKVFFEKKNRNQKIFYCKNECQQSYVDWLNDPARDWQWALTLTFANPEISLDSAMNQLRLFVRRINRRLYGKNSEKRDERPSISLVVSWERNTSDGIHFHAAIEGIKNVRDENWHLVIDQHNLKSFLLCEWTKPRKNKVLRGGEQMVLKPITNRQGWLRYVVKETTKAKNNVICDYLHKYNSQCEAA